MNEGWPKLEVNVPVDYTGSSVVTGLGEDSSDNGTSVTLCSSIVLVLHNWPLNSTRVYL